MTREEAEKKACELNLIGKHKKDWGYYACRYDGTKEEFQGQYFVARRPKNTEIHIAVFCNGNYSFLEA